MEFEKYFSKEVSDWIRNYETDLSDITLIADKNLFISMGGNIIESPYLISKPQLENIVNLMCKGSIYANQQTLKDGYITLKGGDRVGVTGTCVNADGKIGYMRNITAINIRISREIIGAADKVLPYLKGKDRIYNTLIISPPSAGKTTLLRDITRQLGNQYRVGVVDERGEISNGKDLGKFSFVMSECDKSDGVIMLLRSMSPNVILTDEIGTENDEYSIKKLLNAGVKIICTAHGFDEKDVLRRSVFKNLIEGKVFERIIVLSSKNGPGTLEKVIDNH